MMVMQGVCALVLSTGKLNSYIYGNPPGDKLNISDKFV